MRQSILYNLNRDFSLRWKLSDATPKKGRQRTNLGSDLDLARRAINFEFKKRQKILSKSEIG